MSFYEFKKRVDDTIFDLENQATVDPNKLLEFAEALSFISKDLKKTFSPLGAYLNAINEICYFSNKVENPEAHKKVVRLVVECHSFIDKVVLNPLNDIEKKALTKKVDVEMFKVDKMFHREFYSLKYKKSS